MGWLGANTEYFYNLSAKIDAHNELQSNTRALDRLTQLGDKLNEQAHTLEGEVAKETAKESSNEEDKDKDKTGSASSKAGQTTSVKESPKTTPAKPRSDATVTPKPTTTTTTTPQTTTQATPAPLISPKSPNQLKLDALKQKQEQLQGYRKKLELRNAQLKNRIEHHTARADDAKKQIDSRNNEFAYFWS